MKRILIVTQLSNYNAKGRWILECDSGWQMVMGRVREMLKLNTDLHVTVTGPNDLDCMTSPYDVNVDLWENHEYVDKLSYVELNLVANAIVTRYDFDWRHIAQRLNLAAQKLGEVPKWDVVYLNDPMTLRGFKAMFHVVAGYQPKFVVHSHFIDEPSCPKFPLETSMWMGQVEAARKADLNFWQCESSMKTFFNEMIEDYHAHVVKEVAEKSFPWDDGYSIEEITREPDMSNVRFDVKAFKEAIKEKVVIFVPNRIGGRGRSSDYTNCGKFMFELLPELAKNCRNFVVIAGNPSQKFSNTELEQECGKHGYMNLVPDALNRDEFRYVARHSTIALGLYNQDTYGGTVARECIELGCLPLWLDNFEYANIAREASADSLLCKADFSDLVNKLASQIAYLNSAAHQAPYAEMLLRLQRVVRARCSYEHTTRAAMEKMGLL